MTNEKESALRVIGILVHFESRFDQILNMLEGKRSVTSNEKQSLQALLTSLKADLKAAAKRTPQNHYERAFLFPAIAKAAANLSVAVNSHPINSNWYSCLYEVRIDINYPLYQLREQFPSEQ